MASSCSNAALTTLQATFGHDAGEVPFEDVAMSYGDELYEVTVRSTPWGLRPHKSS